jgi:hypothetical protein
MSAVKTLKSTTVMKLGDETLSTVSGGRGRHLALGHWKKVDVAQSNFAFVFAPGNKGTIDIDQSNTAVVA